MLSGTPLYQGSIVGTFVKTDGTPRTVNHLELDVGYINTARSVHVMVYGLGGSPLLEVSAPAAIKAQSSVHVARNAIRVVASSVANNTSSAWLNSKRRAAGTETASNPLDIKCPVIIRRAVRLLPSK